MERSINQKENIKLILEKYSPYNTIIISENHELKNYTKLQVFSTKELCEYLLKKSPLLFFPTILSTEEGSILTQSIIEKTFITHSSFKNLIKSTNFAKVLYQLFNKFFFFEINPQKFEIIINNINLSDDDFTRLSLISQSYKLFEKTLKENNFLTSGFLFSFIMETFQKYPQFLEITKENAQNIIIDENLELYPSELNLLKNISKTLVFIQLQEKTNNIAAKIITEKYLKTELNYPLKESSIKLFEFNDILEEAKFITSDIIEKINTKNYKPSDFTIALNNHNSFKIFNDTLNQAGLGTNLSNKDESFQYFYIKLNQYLQICSNFKKLNSQTIISKSEQEKIYEEINLYFENIITETLDNQFIKDKFLQILENSNYLSLIDCVRENIKILTLENQEKIQAEINKIEELSKLYNSLKLSLFIGSATQNIPNITTDANKSIAKLIKKVSLVEKFFGKIKKTTINNQELIDLFNFQELNKNENANCVKITPIYSLNETTKIIYIPDFTDKAIPHNLNQVQFISNDANEKISQEINKNYNNFKNIIENNSEQVTKSAQNLVNILSRPYEEIIISTHKYEEKKEIAPSMFFNSLLSTIQKTNHLHKTKNKESIIKTENNEQIFIDENKIILDENEQIQLNASAISNFQTCPRKYYFSNLIGLKSKGTFAANYGTIVHCVLELFNQKFIESYNKETLQKLAQILFNSNKEPQLAIDTGFSQRNIDLICATDTLSLEDMSTQLLDAIDSLNNLGFFNKRPDEVICEKSFKFEHPALPNIIFDGRIDAIYRFGNNYTIVDFKTGGNKPELNYLISDNGVNFKTPTGRETNIEAKQKEYEYQIPIYYFATKYSQDLKNIKGNIERIGLQYIRPKNKHQGYKEDFITCDVLEEFEEQIIQNLKTTIIEKIKNKTYFEPQINEIICKNCSFKCLCEEKNEDENESNN